MPQQWEYCEMDWADTMVRFYRPDGVQAERIRPEESKGDRTDRDAWRRTIAQLGLDGWELVGIRDSAGGYHMYFKRPIATEEG